MYRIIATLSGSLLTNDLCDSAIPLGFEVVSENCMSIFREYRTRNYSLRNADPKVTSIDRARSIFFRKYSQTIHLLARPFALENTY